jgi:pimeloyl-ACP methyl ester carboxylesterase
MRVELHLPADAYATPHVLLMTLGGPIYCGLLLPLAQYLNAVRLCPDYGRNGETSGASENLRFEDWGDPRYLDAVAKLPDQLRRQGVKVSKLVVMGVSYSGYANAELIATHPELHPAALFVIDSYFDLAARYRALPKVHHTRTEMESALGGTPSTAASAYGSRSPSNHLDGIAAAVRHGTKLVVVWSVAPSEQREFLGATCSLEANAKWLRQLAGLLHRPVTGYVTRMKHADVLRNWGQHLLALAGVAPRFSSPLPARAFAFSAGAPVPAGSYCR